MSYPARSEGLVNMIIIISLLVTFVAYYYYYYYYYYHYYYFTSCEFWGLLLLFHFLWILWPIIIIISLLVTFVAYNYYSLLVNFVAYNYKFTSCEFCGLLLLLLFHFLWIFNNQHSLVVFLLSLSDNKSFQVSWTLLSIWADHNNVVVWIVPNSFSDYQIFHSICQNFGRPFLAHQLQSVST